MSEETIFTDREREELCLDHECEEHGDGTIPCQIPQTKREAKAQLRSQSESSSSALGSAEPKEATADVVLADGAENAHPTGGNE